eukprot:2903572-Pyramimonas_sp.AAC.1
MLGAHARGTCWHCAWLRKQRSKLVLAARVGCGAKCEPRYFPRRIWPRSTAPTSLVGGSIVGALCKPVPAGGVG